MSHDYYIKRQNICTIKRIWFSLTKKIFEKTKQIKTSSKRPGAAHDTNNLYREQLLMDAPNFTAQTDRHI